MFTFEVETWNEDIYTLEYEYETLKEAIEEAQAIAYRYKAISIIKIDEVGNKLEEYDIYGEEL